MRFPPPFRLAPAPRVTLPVFIDCNLAQVRVGGRLRLFPGKYGEDPVWGDARDLRVGEGDCLADVMALSASDFTEPVLPPNAAPGEPGLHGAFWFETAWADPSDPRGERLYALYHNENYPSTLPWDPATGHGLTDRDWPPGLLGADSVQAVPRIGIMRSDDGGDSWSDRGIVLEDRDDRMIRLPVNANNTFPGGVGDPCAVLSGDHLYVFFGEYAYPRPWDAGTHDPALEHDAQCVSVARLPLSALDAPHEAARRWDGTAFAAAWDGPGRPVEALRVPTDDGGGPVSAGDRSFLWGPSVSWNEAAACWVMLLGRVDAPSWVGSRVYVSFNPHADLGADGGAAAQDWTTPVLLLDRPGHTLWYPALQPSLDPGLPDAATERGRTGARLGARCRLFVKDVVGPDAGYHSDHEVHFGDEPVPDGTR